MLDPSPGPAQPFTCSWYAATACARPELVNGLLRTFLAGGMDYVARDGKREARAAEMKHFKGSAKQGGILVHAAPAVSGVGTPRLQD